MPTKLQARAARKSAKRDEKKRQIAHSALSALQELGFANTSLRDIAERCDLSLGMLHYYFVDRSDLILFCVTEYKHDFLTTLSLALDGAEGREQVIDSFATALATSIQQDAQTHRLWYDIRAQAMFDPGFRPVVADLETRMIALVGRVFDRAGQPVPEQVALYYAMLDGVFRYLMQAQTGPAPLPHTKLYATFRDLLARFL